MSEDLNRDWALRYAETGISIFPCATANKRPLIRWRSGSATNAGCIAAMWNRWPGSLVGIDLHKCGLVVFDADRHNGRADGVGAFATLLRKYDTDLSAVPITHTPNNGFHFYFRQPDEPLTNREGDLPEGVNVRGSGGFAIAPFCVRSRWKKLPQFRRAPQPDYLLQGRDYPNCTRLADRDRPQAHDLRGVHHRYPSNQRQQRRRQQARARLGSSRAPALHDRSGELPDWSPQQCLERCQLSFGSHRQSRLARSQTGGEPASGCRLRLRTDIRGRY